MSRFIWLETRRVRIYDTYTNTTVYPLNWYCYRYYRCESGFIQGQFWPVLLEKKCHVTVCSVTTLLLPINLNQRANLWGLTSVLQHIRKYQRNSWKIEVFLFNDCICSRSLTEVSGFILEPRTRDNLPKEIPSSSPGTCHFLNGYKHEDVKEDASLDDHVKAALDELGISNST